MNTGLLILLQGILREALLLGYSDHTQHLNGFAFPEILGGLSLRPKKFYIVIAASLPDGRQTEDLGSGTRAVSELLEAENIHFLKVARMKDIHLFPKEERRKKIVETKEALMTLVNSVNPEADAGVGVFPETTTQGAVQVARQTSEGQIEKSRSGMIEVTSSLLPDLARVAEEAGREVIWFPFANNKTYRIVEPRTTTPHLRAKLEIGKHKLTGGLLKPTPLAEVRFGKPFTTSDMKDAGVDLSRNIAVNTFAMMRVAAEKRPVEDAGFYR